MSWLRRRVWNEGGREVNDIRRTEVVKKLKKMKSGKSAGLDVVAV